MRNNIDMNQTQTPKHAELDAFLVEYITKKDNSLGLSANNIHHFNRQLKKSAIIGRLKALSNRGKLKMGKLAYYIDEEVNFVNVYFKVETI